MIDKGEICWTGQFLKITFVLPFFPLILRCHIWNLIWQHVSMIFISKILTKIFSKYKTYFMPLDILGMVSERQSLKYKISFYILSSKCLFLNIFLFSTSTMYIGHGKKLCNVLSHPQWVFSRIILVCLVVYANKPSFCLSVCFLFFCLEH